MPDVRRIPPLTVESMRSMAEAQGLDLTDTELAALMPLVAVGRDPLSAAPDMAPETEPAVRFVDVA